MRHRRSTRWSRYRASAGQQWQRTVSLRSRLQWRRAAVRLAMVIVALAPFVALANWTPPLPSSPNSEPIVVPLPGVADDVWENRGTIVSLERFDPPSDDGDDVLGEAWKAEYASVSGVDGAARVVSGAFFVPRGIQPDDGWPVISFAHGTTGIGNECGPTRQLNFQGYWPVVQQLLDNGYAVALSDYEGLGATGTHPYLEPATAAFNVIDAARALRNITPTVSDRWVAFGYSQGGQAVWAANELNPYYGEGLNLLGTMALAPASNVSGVAEMAWDGVLTREQQDIYPLLVSGLARYTPDFDESGLMHGSLADPAQWLSRCTPPSETPKRPVLPLIPWKQVTIDRVPDDERRPSTRADVDEFRTALRRIALPQRPLSEPMLVIAGGNDSLVFAQWVQSSVLDSCALGGTIEYVAIPDATHTDILWKAGRTIQQWVAERFDGAVAPSNCPAQ